MCAPSRKVTLKNATPKEVNTPIGEKIVGCVSLSIGKWIIFLKLLEFNSLGTFIKYVDSKQEEGGKGRHFIV